MKKLSLLFWFFLLLACQRKIAPNKYDLSENHYLERYNNKVDSLSVQAHLNGGKLYLFQPGWYFDDDANQLSGKGTIYDYDRHKLKEGWLELGIDSVVFLEGTMALKDRLPERVATLMVTSTINALLAAYCITNPKACFGSCPTFYTKPAENLHYSAAEGFSSAILPSMEYGDIDDLMLAHEGGSFNIQMRNEAAERHLVNKVSIYSVPLDENRRALHAPNDTTLFYTYEHLIPPSSCSIDSALALLTSSDKQEYRSLTAAHSLTQKEELEFAFANVPAGPLGLVLDYRQGFVSTFLFYKVFDMMGADAVKLLARMEYDADTRADFYRILEQLGSIEILVYDWESESYKLETSFNEQGPIAINRQLHKLKSKVPAGKPLKVKLRYTKGVWCFDAIAVATALQAAPFSEVLPAASNPPSFEGRVREDDSLYLVAEAGNVVDFQFELPNGHQQLFLYSKGYYLEYLRSEWLQDKDLISLFRVAKLDPFIWRSLAKEYKDMEASYREDFFNSRYSLKPKL